MTKKTKTQVTPKGHEIPVPTRGYFFENLKKVTAPEKSVKHPKK